MKKSIALWMLITSLFLLIANSFSQSKNFDFIGIWKYSGIGNETEKENSSKIYIEIKSDEKNRMLVTIYRYVEKTKTWNIEWGYAKKTYSNALLFDMEYPAKGIRYSIIKNNVYSDDRIFIKDEYYNYTGQFVRVKQLPESIEQADKLPENQTSGKTLKQATMNAKAQPGDGRTLAPGSSIILPMHVSVIDISGEAITLEILGSSIHVIFIGIPENSLSNFAIGDILEKGTVLVTATRTITVMNFFTDIVNGKRVFLNPKTLKPASNNEDFIYRYECTYSDGTKFETEWRYFLAY